MTTNKNYFKKKSKPAVLIAIVMIGLILVYYVLREQEVVYSEPKWNCKNLNNTWQCEKGSGLEV